MDRRFWAAYNSTIDGFWGSMIVYVPVRCKALGVNSHKGSRYIGLDLAVKRLAWKQGKVELLGFDDAFLMSVSLPT